MGLNVILVCRRIRHTRNVPHIVYHQRRFYYALEDSERQTRQRKFAHNPHIYSAMANNHKKTHETNNSPGTDTLTVREPLVQNVVNRLVVKQRYVSGIYQPAAG